MSLLTEQEIEDIAEDFSLPYGKEAFARAIEAKARANLLEEIKANGLAAWLHCERQDADIVTDAVKHVWGKAVVGSLALYNIPLYKLPEGE